MILMLSLSTFTVSADTDVFDPYQHFTFSNSDERIASDGTFTYAFHYDLVSGDFVSKATSVIVSLETILGTIDGSGTEYTDPSQTFTLQLYKRNGIYHDLVDTFTGCADGEFTSYVFSGVDKGATYHFQLYPNDPNMQYSSIYFKGSGNVGPVTVVDPN